MKLCYQVATPDVAIADSVTAYQGSLEKSFGDLGRLGYDGVELMTLNPEKLDWNEVKETAEKNGLSVILVCTGEIFGQLGLSYTHPHRSLRREAVERTKEIIDLKFSDRFLYNLAPFMVIIASFLTFACLPINKGLEVLDFNVGVFFLLAASSIGVVGILLAGWSSNNKFSLIGAMRSGAQIISYELSVGLSILTMVVLMGTMQFSEIVESQANGWFIFKGHIPAVIAFIIYLIAGNAECNRGPFDLPEAESELTAGYHTEYSGMHFGFFYLAEYLNLFIVSAVAATIFLGGWMPLHISGLDGFNAVMDYIPGFIWFFAKAFFVVFLLMWVKWTFPRLRIDQILALEWKYLVPISLLNLLLMVLIVVFGLHF